MQLKMTAAEVEAVIREALPMARMSPFTVEEVSPGYARTRMSYADWMLRPGGSLAGPVLMLAADGAMYAAVMSHIGPEVMAVTANMNMNFLARPKPVDLISECKLLKLGRRLAVCEVSLYSEGEPRELVCHVTGSYALPPKAA